MFYKKKKTPPLNLMSVYPLFQYFKRLILAEQALIKPLTPMSDQDKISPYNISTISTRQVMRKKKTINLGIIS